MIVKYDLQGDPRNIHPHEAFKLDGIVILQSEASSFGGCYFLKIEPKDNLPEWYSPSNWAFTFPDKKHSTDI